ncbi:hypothetical protein LEP1GSC161_1712 [Leptospira santarosai str. CBC1416]|uniref:Uncharacterized protein n=3 Tax=Leptospira santarosai TaxID=28183 RepID=M6UKJ6_9LEPT|nr:hypothetical protein LEP1GSC179_3534 [Leptospira santarosai str. MOR084]EKO80082.1 hypothetical protein LEP1GSC068_2369 [Leptospira sp. Fiocruz LV3954]EKR91259.1 hypothetical protein LEP1GSC163_3711 [Leptospira santarosai str. CBC379]EKS08226.1 hypothetical protein LEP1GSC071_2155 [Leptospira santarosai str. JET]EMI67363.1 hypothetical protein LEP1GSC076_1134 [Leptospira sp. Fiocruz LV4135]EMJ49150.1 hypothetical protein LEP1GSC169_1168 [Leptospira santarosai str. HAI1349]EMM85661.1 hypoth
MWELPHFLFGFVGCPENVRIPLLNLELRSVPKRIQEIYRCE